MTVLCEIVSREERIDIQKSAEKKGRGRNRRLGQHISVLHSSRVRTADKPKDIGKKSLLSPPVSFQGLPVSLFYPYRHLSSLTSHRGSLRDILLFSSPLPLDIGGISNFFAVLENRQAE